MDYSKTIIYKITCNDSMVTECYVGHTTNFVKRKYHHKERCNTMNCKIYKIIREHGGWNNWNMTPICQYPCKNRIQACIKEEEYRVELQAELNSRKCINTPKEYYESNKNKILEKNKEYRDEHKEKIAETKKIYYDEHKEQIFEKSKEYYDKNKEQIIEKSKEYYDKNKEQILEKTKEYREKNKEKISEKKKEKYYCPCGSTLRKSDKAQHEKSKKHQDFIKNNLIIDNG